MLFVVLFLFLFFFLLLNRRVKKLKNTRQKKKQQKAHYHALIEFPSTQGGVSVQLVITSLFMQIKKKKSFYADVLEKIGFPRTHHFV